MRVLRARTSLLLLAAVSVAGASSGAVSLPAAVVARAGSALVPASLVGDVAARQSITVSAAVDALVADALLAQGATAAHLDARGDLTGELVAVRAQETVRALHAHVVDVGPATDAEIAELTALHWQQVDVPPALHVIHAVALRPKNPDPAKEAKARAVANAIEQAVVGATSTEDFEARAKAVPHDDVQVTVEDLPPFAENGRITTEGGALDDAFTRGAYAVHTGVTSPVVESSFGWHVIRIVERIPAKRTPLAERRRLFAEEVNAMRGRKGMDALLAELRSRARIQISPAVDAILRDAQLP